MKVSPLFFASLTSIPSFADALAVPEAVPRYETLTKRGGEVNYLTYCLRANVNNMADACHASYMVWYSNSDNTQSGNDHPGSLSSEYRDWAVGGDWLTWEGQQQNIYFPDSGVTVQTHIEGGAQDRAVGSWAGWAQRTSDWKTFNCYRDNSRILFFWSPPNPPVPDGTNKGIYCWSSYWCV